jgi:hypothetical protein
MYPDISLRKYCLTESFGSLMTPFPSLCSAEITVTTVPCLRLDIIMNLLFQSFSRQELQRMGCTRQARHEGTTFPVGLQLLLQDIRQLPNGERIAISLETPAVLAKCEEDHLIVAIVQSKYSGANVHHKLSDFKAGGSCLIGCLSEFFQSTDSQCLIN